MNEIKAFVGHSFTKDDATLVDAFLKYFDQIKKLHPTFSWDHAESAEPRELAEKVLSLIADKNVFIAICTKKERAISPQSLRLVLLQPGYRKARDSDFQWKTSDWIIQEIGLAKGRGLDLVLLVEDGLRLPGGLQGNMEFITFERSAPEKSFGKIVEMIHALSPSPSATLGASANSSPASEDGEKAPPPSDNDWIIPKLEWKKTDYELAMFHAIFSGSNGDADKISAAYFATTEAAEGDSKAEWDANSTLLRIKFGKGGSLDQLEKLANAHPKNGKILAYLANAHSSYDKFSAAAQQYEAAAKVTSNDLDVQRLTGRAAIQYARAGDFASANSIIEKLKTVATSPAAERQLLGVIRELANLSKDEDVALIAMERIVEIAPDDFETRFSLAFKHSELGNEDLALYHYLKVPYNERNSTTWNNIGVSFDRHSMPGKSVSAYRQSEERGESLAMSNLGYKFMNAGFLKEAQEEFDKAIALKDFVKNVGQGLAALKEVPDEEDKKEEEIFKKMKPKGEFYGLLGQAVCKPVVKTLPARLRGVECELDVSLTEGRFRAVGTYERDETNTLLGAFSPGSKIKAQYRIEYEGAIVGRQIDGTVCRVRQDDKPSVSTLLGLGDAKAKVFVVICDDGRELKVMENPHGTSPQFHSLHVV